MPITEPMTLFTDYLLALAACLFAYRLLAGSGGRRWSVRFWAAAFVASGAAAAAGGTVHGFVLVLGDSATAALWKLTVYLIGLAGWSFLTATAFATQRGRLRQGIIALATVKLVFFAFWMVDHDAFRYVVYDYAPALLAVLLLQLNALIRRKDQAAAWIIAGTLVSFVAAGVQMSGFSLHRHFNHNDIYHLIQIGAFYLWFRGGRMLRDRNGEDRL